MLIEVQHWAGSTRYSPAMMPKALIKEKVPARMRRDLRQEERYLPVRRAVQTQHIIQPLRLIASS